MIRHRNTLRALMIAAFAVGSASVGVADDAPPAQHRIQPSQFALATNSQPGPDQRDYDHHDNDRHDYDHHDYDHHDDHEYRHEEEHYRSSQIPPDAVFVNAGINRIDTSAPYRGTLFLYDNTEGRVIWSGPVQRGEPFMLHAADNRVVVGDRNFNNLGLVDGHDYRVFLEPWR